jgi:ADP-ribosylation factor-like protein 2
VDSSDALRLNDGAAELRALLEEEVGWQLGRGRQSTRTDPQRLAGATLLVFANKQDLAGSMPLEQIRDVS